MKVSDRKLLIVCVFVMVGVTALTQSVEDIHLTTYKFRKLFSDGTESVIGMKFGCRSPVSCAEICSRISTKNCTGFHYDIPSLACELYGGLVFGTTNPSLEKVIYKADQLCQVNRGFSVVHVLGYTLCLGYFGDKKTFNDAHYHCQSMSSRLLHLDDPSLKLSAMTKLMSGNTGIPLWVGYSDVEMEGHWLATWTRSDLADVPWNPGEPSNTHNNEHCAAVAEEMLNDRPCTSPSAYVCEAPM